MATCYNRLPKISYIRPKSLAEAVDFLANEGPGKCCAYAGGTDVVPMLKQRTFNPQGQITALPTTLLDLKGIPDLDYIVFDPKTGLRIGALATIRSVSKSAVVKENYPMLSHAAGSIASFQVQNRGTIAGNICNASPSADSASSLLCLNAELDCIGKEGERTIAITDFFVGPGQTALAPGEIVREIRVSPMPENSYGVYIKLSMRKRMDCAVAGAAAVIAVEKGICGEARIGLGAVAPTPIRATAAEQFLTGKTMDEAALKQAGELAAAASSPVDDQRASADYRKMLIPILVQRVLRQAIAGI
jgi:carbon-monoxide dehydrogenase medium subunit